MGFLQKGGYIDLTAGITRENDDPTSISLPKEIKKLEIKIYPWSEVLWSDLRDTILREGIPLSTVLPLVTTNVARLLKLPHKGRITVGNAADLVLLNKDLTINKVIAKGKLMVDDGKVLIKGKFED